MLDNPGMRNMQQLPPQRHARLKHERRQHGQRRRAHTHQHAAGQVADAHTGAPVSSNLAFTWK